MASLVDAARNNDLDGLRRLLQVEQTNNPSLGSDGVNFATKDMYTACAAAAENNHSAAVDMLLDSGCKVMPDVIKGAYQGRSEAVFDSLIARGWDVNMSLGHVGNLLTKSAGHDDLKMVQFLLSRGADPNSGSFRTPLEAATHKASISVIEALLDAGAKLNDGRSALALAAHWGRTDAVSYLLDRGASIDELPDNKYIKASHGSAGIKNALCEAANQGKLDVVQLLLARGADPDISDTNGNSARKLAETGNFTECVSVLQQAEGRKA